jgi:putative ATP-binding cassette transporter
VPLQRLANKRLVALRATQDTLAEHTHALLFGTKELKLRKNRSDRYFQDLGTAAQRTRSEGVRAHFFLSIMHSFHEASFYVIVGALVLLMQGNHAIDAEIRSRFVIATLYIIGPIVLIVRLMTDFLRSEAALKKIREFGIDLTNDTEPETPVDEPRPSWNELELRGVTHAYAEGDRTFTLGPIDMTIRQGETIFVVGGNGGGKTTLAKVLCGLYRPHAGEIRIGGSLVDEANLGSYRAYFGTIFSDFYLFKELIGSDDISNEVKSYLAALRLDHVVQVKDRMVSTIALSQGQRKRLALIDLFLEGRPIWVLDEWAADQDPQFKRIFYEKILADLKAAGRTVVAITHDDRYFGLADRIMMLDDGKLIEVTQERKSN